MRAWKLMGKPCRLHLQKQGVYISFHACFSEFLCTLTSVFMCVSNVLCIYQWLLPMIISCPFFSMQKTAFTLQIHAWEKKTHVVVWTGHSENHFLSALAECMQKNLCLCTMAWTKPQSFPLHPELKCLARHCKENMYWVNIKAAIDYQS